ncbi:MAG: hypothetical protein WCI09_12575, partial [Planctomycetota bacterium]
MPVWVSAATLTWDNGAVAALENPPLTPAGNGLWDTTSFNWAGSAWVNGSAASFTGPAAGTITLNSANISATDLNFNVTGVKLVGSLTNRLTLTNAATIAVATGQQATLSVPLIGSVGLTKTGLGRLSLTDSTALTGTNDFTGTATVTGGTLTLGPDTTDVVVETVAIDRNVLIDATGSTGATLALPIGANKNARGDIAFGTGSVARTMTVQGGGSVNNFRGFRIGTTSTSNGNAVSVSGVGSNITNSNLNFNGTSNGGGDNLWIGDAGSNNSLAFSLGGVGSITKANGINSVAIGNQATATGNSLIVSGTGSRLTTTCPLYVGAAGSSNTLTVRGGGVIIPQRLFIGSAATAQNNTALITGSGSLINIDTTTNSWLTIGSTSGATGNSLTIADGGELRFNGTGTTREFAIGRVAGANSNTIIVTGVNSKVNINFALPVTLGGLATGQTSTAFTAGGSSNRLDIMDGGAMVTVTPVYVGGTPTVGGADSTGNSINLGNGTLNPGVLTVGASIAQYNTATGLSLPVTAYAVPFGDNPLITQGIYLINAQSTLNFNNGQLVAGDSFTGTPLVSGLGTINLVGGGVGSILIPLNKSNSITRPITGTGSLVKEGV